MENRICILFTFLALVFGVTLTQAQSDLLLEEDAVRIALENNYDIRSAGIVRQIAANNASKFNDGSLPTVNASAGASYNFDHAKNKIEDVVVKTNEHSFPFSAGLNVNYTLYDKKINLNRTQLQALFDLSDLQLRQSVELTMLELLTAYWRVAQLEQNVRVKEENLAISQRNLLRSEYAFEYGVTSKLGVLNNEVNVNNDSISLQTAILDYENARRDLNILMGRDASVSFTTDTVITFIGDMNLEQLRADALNNNVFIRMSERNMAVDQAAMEIAQAGWLPTLDLNGGYNWFQSPYIDNSIDYLSNHGVSGGMSLSWNLFDGGRTKNSVQNQKLALEDSRLYQQEITRQVDRDVLNGWASYQNALYVVEAQSKNIETSERNFERTLEQFNLGNITTTTFREAQTNLLNAKLGLLQAMFQAKVYEIRLLQLAGQLTGTPD